MSAWKGHRGADPLAWMRTIRDGIDLSKSVKAVAFCLALHAKPDGSDAHPGWRRLAWQSGCSRRTVLAALGELEHLGLLYCVERGSQFGTRNMASKYMLTLHDELGVLTTTYDAWLTDNGYAKPQRWPDQPDIDPWAAA